MLNDFPDVLTVEDLCEILLIGKNTAYELLGSNSIAALRIGRCWKIPKASVVAYLQSAK